MVFSVRGQVEQKKRRRKKNRPRSYLGFLFDVDKGHKRVNMQSYTFPATTLWPCSLISIWERGAPLLNKSRNTISSFYAVGGSAATSRGSVGLAALWSGEVYLSICEMKIFFKKKEGTRFPDIPFLIKFRGSPSFSTRDLSTLKKKDKNKCATYN